MPNLRTRTHSKRSGVSSDTYSEESVLVNISLDLLFFTFLTILFILFIVTGNPQVTRCLWEREKVRKVKQKVKREW